jgi:hypothetical protein
MEDTHIHGGKAQVRALFFSWSHGLGYFFFPLSPILYCTHFLSFLLLLCLPVLCNSRCVTIVSCLLVYHVPIPMHSSSLPSFSFLSFLGLEETEIRSIPSS